MTVKYATDVIETFDTEKTLGTLNFLETILHKKWEEVDVKLYSSAVNGDITVTVPPEAKVAQMTAEKNYNDEVVLVAPTARFWTNTEIINGNRVVSSGVKIRAKDVSLLNKPEAKKEG